MVEKRLLLLLGGCLLMASAAWADDVGFIDCHEHPDATQVFAKARQTHEIVASLPCGERFTILLYGFIFSRIQTKDGQVGYVFSNVISVDHSGAVVQRTAPAPVSAAAPNPASSAAPVAPANPTAAAVTPATPAQAPSPSAQAALTPAPEPAAKARETNASAAQKNAAPIAPAQPQNTTTQPASLPGPETVTKAMETGAPVVAQANPPVPTQPSTAIPQLAAAPEPASSAPEKSSAAASDTKTQPAPALFPQPVTAPTEPTPNPEASSSASGTRSPETSAPETNVSVAQPNPPAAAEAQPEAAEPVRPAIRAADAKERWEKPNRGTHRAAVLEFFGGYEFARLVSGGTATNLNGVLGSFGWNVKPWLELVADTSYNTVTISGTKNVLYGNHWGPRFYYHGRYPWGATPFVEALVGGSRADTTVSGPAGYKTSDIGISYKFGGGVDIRPVRYARHFKIRLFDFDYYRTSFGTNLHQNNYSLSTGIVLRLFGGGSE